ncbi:DUF4263 domain-containing protein [Mesorhizobium sp. M5C.F.Cr.IN.023.01.1.1]|uniref:Shedu anti-phage system protein SduA domain-containing protein n=1 Tax=Mesorhizobium sp. M5C.F.Cr.IN.023.01.1.1 TaxID=2496768 RepID=UPI000FCC2DD6|nr:Shedu anti-phage system protein SduA domain-containing protein [Mesorhizobium sp. M5C.F.Cr.IN.023.01.1.1]RUV67124.1 DUF4263 domain-containing protein [Mesorhizobium sp. M5C.F.Cr.IN.023.01.1.1]
MADRVVSFEPINGGMDVDRGIRLLIHTVQSGYWLEAKLTEKAIDLAREEDPDFSPPTEPIVLADYDAENRILFTYPRTLYFGRHFLEQKYGHLGTIIIEGVDPLDPLYLPGTELYFEDFPTGIIKAPLAGFGLTHDMRFIVDAVERLGYREIALTISNEVISSQGVLFLPYKTFDLMRRAINRTHNAALAVANRAKVEYVQATLNVLLDEFYELPVGPPRRTLDEILVEKLIGRKRSAKAETVTAVKTVRKSMRSMAQAEPADLMDLHREIELVTLEELIERIAKKIEQATLTENHWQEFLTANAFVLQLAFNLPALMFDEQVAVGGTRFDGGGGKVVDYLLRVGGMGNLAIVEIKKPATKLLETRQYRQGLHAPTAELSGAISQVLDQRYRLQQEINNKKMASRVFDIYAYAVPGIVIAGVAPTDPDQQKSFELFRNNLRDVTVITFDELLSRLRALHEFLKSPPKPEPGPAPSEDLPC